MKIKLLALPVAGLMAGAAALLLAGPAQAGGTGDHGGYPPKPTVTVTVTTTVPGPQSTATVTESVPGPTVTATETKTAPGATVTVTETAAGPTATVTKAGPTVTETEAGPTVTETVPGPTATETVVVPCEDTLITERTEAECPTATQVINHTVTTTATATVTATETKTIDTGQPGQASGNLAKTGVSPKMAIIGAILLFVAAVALLTGAKFLPKRNH